MSKNAYAALMDICITKYIELADDVCLGADITL